MSYYIFLMQNRNLIIGGIVGLVIVLAVGFFLLSQNKAVAPTATPSVAPSVMEESPSPSESASPSGVMEDKKETVTLNANGFSPANLTIKTGTTVIWTNKSGQEGNVSSDPHPIHTNYPPLNLGSFANGDSVSLTFDKAGTYGYHDHLNPSFKGTIIVQ